MSLLLAGVDAAVEPVGSEVVILRGGLFLFYGVLLRTFGCGARGGALSFTFVVEQFGCLRPGEFRARLFGRSPVCSSGLWGTVADVRWIFIEEWSISTAATFFSGVVKKAAVGVFLAGVLSRLLVLAIVIPELHGEGFALLAT